MSSHIPFDSGRAQPVLAVSHGNRNLLISGSMLLTLVAGAISLLGTLNVWPQAGEASQTLVLLLLVGAIVLLVIKWGLTLLRQRKVPRDAAWFAAAMESSQDAFLIYSAVKGADGKVGNFRCIYLNQNASDLLGRPAQECLSALVTEQLPFARRRLFIEAYREVLRSGKPLLEEFEVDDERLGSRCFRQKVVRLGDGIAIAMQDITDSKQTARNLLQTERLQSAIIDSASYSIIATDETGLIVSINKTAERMLGYAEAELADKHTPAIIHDKAEMEAYASELSEALGRHVQADFEVFVAKVSADTPDEHDWTYVRKDGSRFPVRLTVTELREGHGKLYGYLGIAYDITEQKRNEAYIRHIALHDVLTGLPNRALFEDRVMVALERAKREKTQVAIALLDLDYFKNINDSLGHQVGDLLLREVAARFTANIRPSDTIARMGGDEFAFVLPSITHPSGASTVLSKIIKALEPVIQVNSHKLHVSASIGVCAYPNDGEDLDTLMRNADTAMYRAKELGRNGYQIFSPEMEQRAAKRMSMENELRHTLEQEGFELYYQPQIDLRENRVIGMEALLRWQRAPGQYVSPAEFIPIAEESGLIVPIGEWVIRTACRQAALFKEQLGAPVRMAVNVSPRQFRQENLVEYILHSLEAANMSPQEFEVEITESMLMSDIDNSVRIIGRLRDAGVHVALDDFGTGYSSLSYLGRLPVDRIKIDQSFVKNIINNQEDESLAKVIVNLAKSLQIPVIAEGVEGAEQLQYIRTTGCDEAQGYYIAQPMSSEMLMTFCRAKLAFA